MPCNCDHLEPNDMERRLQHAAKLYLWAAHTRRQRVPLFITQRAVNIYNRDERCETSLCAFMTSLPEESREVLFSQNEKQAAELKLWWLEHLSADKARTLGLK